MAAAAIERGVRLTSRSRPLQPADLAKFDYIIGMDQKNIRAIMTASQYWIGEGRADCTAEEASSQQAWAQPRGRRGGGGLQANTASIPLEARPWARSAPAFNTSAVRPRARGGGGVHTPHES